MELQRANCMGFSTVVYAGNKFYVPYLASITGTVFADPNRNGIQDFGEPPLPGFTVTINNAARTIDRRTQTNEQGVYIFSNLPPGDYWVLYAPENLRSRETRRDFGVRPVP